VFAIFAVRGFAVRGSIKKSSTNTSKLNAIFAVFDFDWFGLWFYFWIGSNMIIPTNTGSACIITSNSTRFAESNPLLDYFLPILFCKTKNKNY
jgi:hypothetical protein